MGYNKNLYYAHSAYKKHEFNIFGICKCGYAKEKISVFLIIEFMNMLYGKLNEDDMSFIIKINSDKISQNNEFDIIEHKIQKEEL